MLPLVRVGAAVSADVVTCIKLFVMRYNIRIRPPARMGHLVQAFEHGGHTAASTVVALHEACRLSLQVLHKCDVFLCGRLPYPGSGIVSGK